MITHYPQHTGVDPQFQRLVRKCVNGQATDEEIEDARQAAELSPIELLALKEFLKRETSVTFVDDIIHPLCC